ncbi:hypothetical protein FQZ97_632520 [compost metagenome]
MHRYLLNPHNSHKLFYNFHSSRCGNNKMPSSPSIELALNSMLSDMRSLRTSSHSMAWRYTLADVPTSIKHCVPFS